MSVDFAKPPLENLMELMNAKSSVVATVGDFMEIGKPVVLTGDPDGRNTQVKLRTSMDYSHAGFVTVKYNRLPLNVVITPDVNITVEDYQKFDVALDMYRRKYGVYLDEKDIVPEQPFDVSGGDLTYQVAVKSPTDSYGYTGTATLTVNVNWRLDDPELVEVEINRLRQLVQVSIPMSILTAF